MKKRKFNESLSVSQTSVASVEDNDYSLLSPIKSTNEFNDFDNTTTENNSNIILEQDRFLPIANINRIMKSVIPREGKLSKEAKECVQECISEFLLVITSEASERCALEKRKTITGEDLLVAFQTLGFDDYVEPLREFLQKYRDANKVQNNSKSGEVIDENNYMQSSILSVYNEDSSILSSQVSQQQQNIETINNNIQIIEQPTQKHTQQTIASPTNLQPMQMFYDSTTGQHYITIQSVDGTQSLLPVNLTPSMQQITTVPTKDNKVISTSTNVLNTTTKTNTLPTTRKPRISNKNIPITLPDGEQTVRHYLQSQELKHRKATKK